MKLRDLLPARRPWRLLRQGLSTLARIADALEASNRLQQLLHPKEAALLGTRAEANASESSVVYVDAGLVARAESTRARVYHETGKVLDDQSLLEYLYAEEQLEGTRPD